MINKNGAIQLSTTLIVKIIIAIFMLLIFVSIFEEAFIPFLGKQNIIFKLILLLGLGFLFQTAADLLARAEIPD